MPIARPGDGTVIDTTDIILMHQDVRSVINSVVPANIERDGLGAQHLPSCIAWLDGGTTPGSAFSKVTSTTLNFTAGANNGRYVAETDADITANWLILSTINALWNVDNVGAGFTLPPCKVLVMMHAQVRTFTNTSSDQQFWMVPTYSIDGTPVHDINLAGMIQGHNFSVAGNLAQQERAMSWYFIIDQTGAGGTWRLNYVRARAAGAPGSAVPGVYPTQAVISNGFIGFIPFYRDV
jgi:hypothetical protein